MGARLFLVIVSLLLLAMFFFVLWLLVWPVITEFFRARSAGDMWLPFLPREDGEHGPLASNRWWALFRAPSRGSAGDLAWRWTAWVLTSIGLVVGISSGVWNLGRLLVRGWV